MKTSITIKLLEYINDRNLSYKNIQKTTGMSLTNIKELLHKPDYGVSSALICRFIAAYRDFEIIETIFEDYPQVIEWLQKYPDAQKKLRDTDLVQMALIMRCYFLEPEAFFHLFKIFYVLIDSAARSEHSTGFSDTVSFDNALERLNSSCDKLIIEDLIRSFFSAADNTTQSTRNYISISPTYPELEYPNAIRSFLNSGETITWTDIGWYLSKERSERKISLQNLNKKTGIPINSWFRLEQAESKSYNLEDICRIDKYLNSEGLFLSSCLYASRVSLFTERILDDLEKEINQVSSGIFIPDKNMRSRSFYNAMNSFITLFRRVEVWDGYTGLAEAFLAGFRSISSSDPEISRLMDYYSNLYSDFLSQKDTEITL